MNEPPEHRLTKAQRSAVAEKIRAAGLDPSTFVWSTASSTATEELGKRSGRFTSWRDVPEVDVVEHSGTGATFGFDVYDDERWSVVHPAEEPRERLRRATSWDDQLGHIRCWLRLVCAEAGLASPNQSVMEALDPAEVILLQAIYAASAGRTGIPVHRKEFADRVRLGSDQVFEKTLYALHGRGLVQVLKQPIGYVVLTLAGAEAAKPEVNAAPASSTSTGAISSPVPTDGTRLSLFISHSSVDIEYVSKLVDLLRTALDLRAKSIRCTSVDGYRLQAGADTNQTLRREVHDAEVLIGVISASSIRSTYVVFELGARWGANRHLVPLLAPATPIDLLEGPLSGLNALRGDQRGELHQLIEDLGQMLGIDPPRASVYESKLETLLSLRATVPQADTRGSPPGGVVAASPDTQPMVTRDEPAQAGARPATFGEDVGLEYHREACPTQLRGQFSAIVDHLGRIAGLQRRTPRANVRYAIPGREAGFVFLARGARDSFLVQFRALNHMNVEGATVSTLRNGTFHHRIVMGPGADVQPVLDALSEAAKGWGLEVAP